jgi:TatA/E family protein of Tat protein translocase
MDISPTELLIALAVALIVLGPTKLPRLARSLGEAMHELKHATGGSSDESHEPHQPGMSDSSTSLGDAGSEPAGASFEEVGPVDVVGRAESSTLADVVGDADLVGGGVRQGAADELVPDRS